MYELKYSVKRTIDGIERDIPLTPDEISNIYFYFDWNCTLSSAWERLREKHNLSDDDMQRFSDVVNDLAHSYTKTCGYLRTEEQSWVWDEALSECHYEISRLTGVNEEDD